MIELETLSATSLLFENPRISPFWILVFPFGLVVGLAYLAWILIHFEAVFG